MISTSTHANLQSNSSLNSLLLLRWFSLISQILVLVGLVYWLHVDLPIELISPALLLLLMANGVGYWQLRHAAQVSNQRFMAHLIIDFLALSWVLYCTGGASNPFASLLLLPLTLSAITLPGYWLWVTTPLAVATYTALVFYNIPLPPPQGSLQLLDQVLAETCSIGGIHGSDDSPGSGFALHVAGMWVNFAVSACIVYFFLARQEIRLRQQELALQTWRERSLREEKILALGLMAANAAHKLGTPLATLSVMLGEVEPNAPTDQAEIELMRDQITHCKSILAEMVASTSLERRPSLSITDWIEGLIDEWHLLRPNALRPKVCLLSPNNASDPISPDRTLDQAIQGLLDNAADAVIDRVSQSEELIPHDCRLTVELNWDRQSLQIDILDCGTGIPEELAKLLGGDFVQSNKNTPQHAHDEHKKTALSLQVGGLGIGFFLTNATIERFEGKVELFNLEPQGTRTRIQLPLKRILPN
jgi:two-component system, sensor histidine kinase RegB